MDLNLKQQFSERWAKYFPGAEWPVAFYYTDDEPPAAEANVPPANRCLIGALAPVRAGHPWRLSSTTPGCAGGKRFTGFSTTIGPHFDYFLSCGIPGELEGERYKKSPELVRARFGRQAPFEAPGKYLVFKRFDKLQAEDQPVALIFFAPPDVLSGLFTLANYDEDDVLSVIAPMGSGCSSIIQYPMRESQSDHPRAVLGMFDVSARPHVPRGMLTFTIPWQKFTRMVADMDESFLITKSWATVRARLAKETGKAKSQA
jgi:hypothetical protein